MHAFTVVVIFTGSESGIPLKKLSKQKSSERQPISWHEQVQVRMKEGLVLLLVVLSVFFWMVLISFNPKDPSFSQASMDAVPVQNWGGRLGAWVADILFSAVGYFAWVFPILLVIKTIQVFLRRYQPIELDSKVLVIRSVGFILLMVSGAGLAYIFQLKPADQLTNYNIIGETLGGIAVSLLNSQGASLLLFAAFLIGFTTFTNLSWFNLMEKIGKYALVLWERLASNFQDRQQRRAELAEQAAEEMLEEEDELDAQPVASLKQRKEPELTSFSAMVDTADTTSGFDQQPAIAFENVSSLASIRDQLVREPVAPVSGPKIHRVAPAARPAPVSEPAMHVAPVVAIDEPEDKTEVSVSTRFIRRPASERTEPTLSSLTLEEDYLVTEEDAFDVAPLTELDTAIDQPAPASAPEVASAAPSAASQTASESLADMSVPSISRSYQTEQPNQFAQWQPSTSPNLVTAQTFAAAQPVSPTAPESAVSQPTIGPATPAMYHPEPVASAPITPMTTVDRGLVGTLPPLSLLDTPSAKAISYSEQELMEMSHTLETKLKEFGVQVTVESVHPGPVVTRFEIELAPGIKVSRITNLAKDLARSMAMISVRVVEVIPGKTTVGIEVPNENRQIVRLVEVIDTPEFEDKQSAVSLGLGHDISGQPVTADLAKMPHLLVAGTTGSGKSVGVNAMILSILFKSTPEDARLIMIDPKMLELSIYEGIPHLLCPVVTDMKEAANALRWCVAEMERRYKLMAAMGVRNLAGFNEKIRQAEMAGQPLADPTYRKQSPDDLPPTLTKLPTIVVVVDEFADMIMIVGKKVEELIARIAQKARAAGIHLILATQRPSVDVITGLIKANIPTRMAFQVSSKIDSRTILDQGGAEQLLGHGDMLYLPSGTSVPTRVHGAFVSDEEVHRVVDAWKQRGAPDYIEEILVGEEESEATMATDGEEDDPLFDEAVYFVTESRRASISAVQRKLRVGYNRAARMIEAMEAAGIVSEAAHNGSREVIAPPPVKD